MSTLYEIGADLLALDSLLEERGGDITDPEVAAAIDAWAAELQANLAVKLDGCIGYLRTLEMEAVAARAEADQWNAKASSRELRRDHFKARVKAILEVAGQTKVTTAAGRTVRVQANGGKLPLKLDDPLDVSLIPDRLCVIRREPDRTAIAAAIEAGEELPFARLLPRGTHLRIA